MLTAAGGDSFRKLLGDHAEIHLGYEFLRWVMRRGEHTLPALGLALGSLCPFSFLKTRMPC